jgi:outer membrane protein TolC
MSATRILVLMLSGIVIATTAFGQQQAKVLGFDDFKSIVLQHHPLAMQAGLRPKQGDAAVQMARGGFDPKIGADVNQKYFNGGQYYSLLDAGLKVPTWFGIEVDAGYEQNGGSFLNPENSTSGGGLLYAGLSLAVGRGLFIDERRAELRKAQLYQKSTRIEQRLMLNDLVFEAGNAYWGWFKAHQSLQVYEEAFALAALRLQAVKQQSLLGDRPGIDTLEASIQVQLRQLKLQQAQLDLANAKAQLGIYLWQQGQVPLELAEGTLPLSKEMIRNDVMEQIPMDRLDSLINDHPYLNQYRYEIDQLKIDRRMKVEQLKPQLDLKYNALNQVVGDGTLGSLSPNNFKWGVQFSMPIPLRKERGALRLADMKLQEANLLVLDQRAQIDYKVNASMNTWATSREQALLYQRTVADNAALLAGERQKFDAGESSLFMVNAREVGFIDAQTTYIDLLTDNQKAALATIYSLGLLADDAP